MEFPESTLRFSPKSKVKEKGYINIYSDLNEKEFKGIKYKKLYKQKHPKWDDTLVLLSNKFKELGINNVVLLDAGCGNGNYVVDENRSEIKWGAGVDVSQDSVSKNICLDEIKISSLEKIPFEDNSFDVCVSLWVLEHLENPGTVINEIKRVLKPGGYFMFATPNKNFLPLKMLSLLNLPLINHLLNKRLFGRNEEDIFKTFYRANTVNDLKCLFGEGFEIISLKYNYDPSYISLNDFLFKTGNFLNTVFNIFGFHFHQPHIVGILKKDF